MLNQFFILKNFITLALTSFDDFHRGRVRLYEVWIGTKIQLDRDKNTIGSDSV